MTLDPTVNAVIIGMSGFFIGAVTFVVGVLDPANAEGRPPATPMPFKRGYLKAMREYDAAQKAARALAPRSYHVALAAFGGLIVTVVLGVILSPVDMQWGYFLGGFFLGFLALQGVYTLALHGRLEVETPRFLERLVESDRHDAAGRVVRGSRKHENYREAIERGLSKAFDARSTPTVDVDVDDLRWVIFSDHHKGERDGADDFRRCERSYNAALAAYLERGYTLVALGDVEELWECSPAKVLEHYEHTFELERELHAAGRYVRFWGNHDDAWRHADEVQKHLHRIGFEGLEVLEAQKVRVRQGDATLGLLYLAHGHQGTADSDKFGWFSRLVVRHVWRPLQRRLDMPSTTPSRDWELRARHEAAMFGWASSRPERPVLITGHTHRPVFADSAPEPKTKRKATEVERELSKLRSSPPVDGEKAAALRSEYEYVRAEERRTDRAQPVVPPCYFNTGCCSYGDGDVTGLELADGEIRLVRWTCSDGAPARSVLAGDSLADVLATVAGRAAQSAVGVLARDSGHAL